jgi:hypothetical protein
MVTEIWRPVAGEGTRAQTVGVSAEVVTLTPTVSTAASEKQFPLEIEVTTVEVPETPVAAWTKGPPEGPWKRVYVSVPAIADPSVFFVGAVQPS